MLTVVRVSARAQAEPMTTTAPTSLPTSRAGLLPDLAARLRGRLALPGTEDYDRLTSGFNSAVRPRPIAVAAVADAYDVAHAVRLAAQAGVRVGVQCTGHGAAATMEGALLLHTAALDECVMHPEGWVRVGAGVRWRTVIDAAAPLGLLPLAGSSSGVGVVGYTTGGGLGPLLRTYGLASDTVRALDVVTASGRLLRVTPTEHADLFWGLRGGRGALGVVTAVELDLVRVPEVYGGALHFDGADAAAVLHAWARWTQDLPDTATTSIAIRNLPPLPHVPPQLAGRTTVALRLAVVGSSAQAERLLEPMRAVALPVLGGMGRIPLDGLDRIHQDPTDPMPVQDAAVLLRSLPGNAVDALLAVAGPGSGSPVSIVELRHLGGALARGSRTPSAFCGRDAGFLLHGIGMRVPPVADAVAARLSAVLDAMDPWSTGGTFPSFGGGGARAHDSATTERLRELSDRHDPDGLLVAADWLRALP